jgi:hypothetical protein
VTQRRVRECWTSQRNTSARPSKLTRWKLNNPKISSAFIAETFCPSRPTRYFCDRISRPRRNWSGSLGRVLIPLRRGPFIAVCSLWTKKADTGQHKLSRQSGVAGSIGCYSTVFGARQPLIVPPSHGWQGDKVTRNDARERFTLLPARANLNSALTLSLFTFAPPFVLVRCYSNSRQGGCGWIVREVRFSRLPDHARFCLRGRRAHLVFFGSCLTARGLVAGP